jgi:competence protein ComEC
MNKFIVGVNNLPYSVFDGVAATLTSTILLYCFVVYASVWLLKKNKAAFIYSLFALFFFVLLNFIVKWNTLGQQKVIVYNVPQHQAIDFVDGNDFEFFGDSILLKDGMLQNFHIKPGRIAMHLQKKISHLQQLLRSEHFFQFNNKRILVIDSSVVFEPVQQKIDVDAIIISKNPKLYIPQLAQVFNCKRYIFDASNSLWKIGKWQKDCEQLHLTSYSVPEEGAFIMDL